MAYLMLCFRSTSSSSKIISVAHMVERSIVGGTPREGYIAFSWRGAEYSPIKSTDTLVVQVTPAPCNATVYCIDSCLSVGRTFVWAAQ